MPARKSQTASLPRASFSLPPARVVIVDGDRTARAALRTVLDGTPGFRCVAVYKSPARLARSSPRSPVDVALLDLDGQKTDAIFRWILKLKKRFQGLKVLVWTASEEETRILRSFQSGADGYLLKGTAPGELLHAIQELKNGGGPMSRPVARRLLSYFHKLGRVTPNAEKLTERELAIVRLICAGKLDRDIAEKLAIKYGTVRAHLRTIYRKLGVTSRTEVLVRFRGK
jgi:DNA-binding NarL/FixJ family response regulator